MEKVPKLFDLLSEDDPKWTDILEEACKIESARYVDPISKLTPLHLAVMKKDPSEVRVAVVRSLLQSDLNSTEVTCRELGYTPLMYACIANPQLQIDVPIVKLLLEYNPHCFRMTCPEGHSALDIHIMSMSRLMQQERRQKGNQNNSKLKGSCTLLLKALTEYDDLGIALTKSLDLLLSCNSLEVLEHVTQEEALAFAGRLRDKRKQRKTQQIMPVPSASRNVQNFWVWQFCLTLLKSEHRHTYADVKPVPPFNALHTASQVVDFPLPFLMLCMRAYPSQVRTPSIGQSE